MHTMAAGAATLAAPAVLGIGRAKAAGSNTIRMMGGATAAPKDWSLFEKETGLKMEFTAFNTDNVGALYNEILVNQAGERFDIIAALAGEQENLIKQDQVAELDLSKLKNYSGIAEDIKKSPVLFAENGKDWSVPLYYNADSFGYFPEKLDLPRPPQELTWDVVLDNKKTLGRTAMDDNIITLQVGGMYLKSHGLAEIEIPQT